MSEFLNRMSKWIVAIVVPLVAIAALVAALIIWGPQHAAEQTTGEIWTCSMHPQVRLPKPGPCPICGMALIPVSQLQSEQARVKERADLETEKVAFRELFKQIRTVGKLDYNERRLKLISGSWVSRLLATNAGSRNDRGRLEWAVNLAKQIL